MHETQIRDINKEYIIQVLYIKYKSKLNKITWFRNEMYNIKYFIKYIKSNT